MIVVWFPGRICLHWNDYIMFVKIENQFASIDAFSNVFQVWNCNANFFCVLIHLKNWNSTPFEKYVVMFKNRIESYRKSFELLSIVAPLTGIFYIFILTYVFVDASHALVWFCDEFFNYAWRGASGRYTNCTLSICATNWICVRILW